MKVLVYYSVQQLVVIHPRSHKIYKVNAVSKCSKDLAVIQVTRIMSSNQAKINKIYLT